MNKNRVGRMDALMREISPLQRMINSPGLDEAFDRIQKLYPAIRLHEYPCGSRAEDWEVPKSWKYISGTMKAQDGQLIASTEECPLFIAPYSEAVDGWFSKDEIQKRLRTRPDMPDAFALEHRNAYNYSINDWGITLPHNRWNSLPEGKYHIQIEVEYSNGSMKAAEWVIEGKTEKIICLNAHIDELCNDDLSGCVVGLEIMKTLEALPTPNYTYQLLLTPELIGTLFYVHNNPAVVERTVGHLNLEALGAGEKLCLKHALSGSGYLDSALAFAMMDLGLEYRELQFFEGYGNDERVYEWPTVRIPGVALQRYPFAQYHTSEDTPDNIDYAMMEESVQVGIRFIEILEQDVVPYWNGTLTPWLTKRGLYFDCTEDPEKFQKFNNIVLFNLDGNNSVMDLARMANLGFGAVKSYLDRYMKQGCVAYRESDQRRLQKSEKI